MYGPFDDRRYVPPLTKSMLVPDEFHPGWLPSYSIAAVLLQIKLAISNLDPRPARLAPNWDA